MKKLILIYHFVSSRNLNDDFIPASYRVLYFISDSGFLERRILQEAVKSFPEANQELISFQSLDELKDFALKLSQDLGGSNVRLISVQDYNIGMDGAKDIVGFKSIFDNFGEDAIVESVKKKSLLNKIFG